LPRSIAGNEIFSSSGSRSRICGLDRATCHEVRAGVTRTKAAIKQMAVREFQDLARQRGCHRGFNADPTVTRQLYARMPQIDTGDQAQDIQLDTFDPANLDAGIAVKIDLEASAAVGPPRIKAVAEIAPDGI